MMKRTARPATRRAEIQRLYQCYTADQLTLAASSLLRFLHREQMELTANQETVERLIDRYEIDETARTDRAMTFEGFHRYMESKDCSVLDQSHTVVYQDMDQPLCHYFISTSHNTYLTGDQLVGKSHLDAYVSALRKGCRCLEIDCWDGPNTEPVVYHGYTLTTKILFRDVVTTVEQHAFEVSPYPVILSLENHCCQEQQVVMAQYLISILGEKLLKTPLDLPTSGELPSPNDLKYKVLIKNKKIRAPNEAGEEAASREADESEEEEEGEEGEEDEGSAEPSKFWSLRKQKKKVKKVMVAEALSDLVIYTQSVKFTSFSHARLHQTPHQNTSMGEKKARKLARASGPDFILHNQRCLSRIYPAGSRTSSSNYNPQEFWSIGSQLVALNFQSLGLPMDLNGGRFQDNGRCGYVLKPAALRRSGQGNSASSLQGPRPTQLLLKVISGSHLPVPRSGKTLDSFVRVEVHGVHSACRKNTDTVKNSLSPCWDASMNFSVSDPELSLLRFSVRDQTGLLSSELVGQYSLAFSSMKRGYRWLPLLSREGFSMDPASLFVFVWCS
ncbi:unnamed protein product [Arctogadus glacialis]